MIRRFLLEPWQGAFVKSEARFPAMVSAWGTGKTLCGILKVLGLAERHPNNLILFFRKEYTDLRDSSCKDFEKYTGLKINSSREVELPNKSVIMFRHLEEVHNLQNVNAGAFLIEQAEELDSDEQFQLLRGRLRRDGVPHQGIIIANTRGRNWIYKLWKANNDPDFYLTEASTFDNAHNLPEDFIADLKKLEVSAPKNYRRFVLNSWDEADTTDVVIQSEWVAHAAARQLNIKHPIRRVVACDVARYGDDRTVAYAVENGRVIGRESWEKKSTMETVGRLNLFAKRMGNIESFAIDEIGVGGGVVDRLEELGNHVISVNASERADNEGFYNRRAEIYSYGAGLFESGLVSIPPDDNELIEELSWAKYKTIRSSGGFQVEAKEDIKKRYGRSPDHADALLIGLWAVSQAKIYDGFGEYDAANAPMVVSSAVPKRAPFLRARRSIR